MQQCFCYHVKVRQLQPHCVNTFSDNASKNTEKRSRSLTVWTDLNREVYVTLRGHLPPVAAKSQISSIEILASQQRHIAAMEIRIAAIVIEICVNFCITTITIPWRLSWLIHHNLCDLKPRLLIQTPSLYWPDNVSINLKEELNFILPSLKY